jgi:hypothetical protein
LGAPASSGSQQVAALPQLALAETIDLVCTHENVFSVNFAIDTSARSVVSSGKLAHGVFIDGGTISFTLDLNNGAYFHSINRSTGNLLVQGPDGVLVYGHRCERAKPKF